MSINLDSIGATMESIGANAVASEFCKRTKLLHNIDKLLFVSLEYCDRLSNPPLIPLITAENARKATLISKDIPSIRPRLILAPPADFETPFMDFDARLPDELILSFASEALSVLDLYSSTVPFIDL